jgi:hypothetical protein
MPKMLQNIDQRFRLHRVRLHELLGHLANQRAWGIGMGLVSLGFFWNLPTSQNGAIYCEMRPF